MSRRPQVLVLPAFTTADYDAQPDEPDELGHWLDAYDFELLAVDGVSKPVRYDVSAEVALVPTGIGKSATAATVSALFADETLTLESTTVVTVGVAGAPPSAGTIGSVLLADAIVDWDLKHRVADTVEPLGWRVRDYVWDLDDTLVRRAADAARATDLTDNDTATTMRAAYDDDRTPEVGVGPTVCGDEVWHGQDCVSQVEAFCAEYGVDGYVTTEMEDAATATVLERFDALDRYASVRAVSNFDRAPPDSDPTESVDEFAFGLAVENAFRAGRAVVTALCE